MPPAIMPSHEFAARLSARLCHDILSPMSVLTAGLDFLAQASEPAARAEAVDLLGAGVASLKRRLAFCRDAFGHGEAAMAAEALEERTREVFVDLRAQLDWAVTAPTLPGCAARALLNLAEIAGETLAAGGVARVSTPSSRGWVVVEIEAVSPRPRLRAEALAGLLGEPPGPGPAGRWAQAYFVFAQVGSAGGAVSVDAREGAVVLTVSLPA